MRIFYNNIIDTAVLTASSTAAGNNTSSFAKAILADTFTFTSTTGLLVIDLLAATQIKSFIIDIGNMTGGGTYTLEANATDVWTSPSFSESLTISDTALYWTGDETYRYFRLCITDTDNVSLGYIMIGSESYLQMPGIDPGVTLNYETTSSNSISNSGQNYGNIGYERLNTSFTFPMITETEGVGFLSDTVAGRQEIKAMWSEVQNINPVWIFLWANNLDEHPPVFAIFDQDTLSMDKLSQDGKYWKTELEILEVF